MSFRFDRMSVLIVDDNRHTVNLIMEILHGLGIGYFRTTLDVASAFNEVALLHSDIISGEALMRG